MAKNVQIGSVVAKKGEAKSFSLRLAPGVELSYRVKNKDGELIGEGELSDGAYLNMQTPAQRVAFLVENDHITEEKGEEILENIPDYVKYEVSGPNSLSEGKSKKTGKAKASSKSKAKDTDEDDDF